MPPPPARPAFEQGAPPLNPRTSFLTGATGFLGSSLAVELLQRDRERIYCLVRPHGDVHERLRGAVVAAAEAAGVAHLVEDRLDRLVPLAGDIAAEDLGLSDEARAILAAPRARNVTMNLGRRPEGPDDPEESWFRNGRGSGPPPPPAQKPSQAAKADSAHVQPKARFGRPDQDPKRKQPVRKSDTSIKLLL